MTRHPRRKPWPPGPAVEALAGLAAALAAVALLGPAAGCTPSGRPAAVAGPLALAMWPLAGEPARLAVRLDARRAQGARLPARPRPGDRRLAALPAAWDVAVLRLSHPVALRADLVRTLARDVDLADNGAGGYEGAAMLGGLLRPAAGYTLDVELWAGAVETGALVATKVLPLTLSGGDNAVTVSLDVLADPLALTGFAPGQAAWGETVALAGSGLAPAGATYAASLGGAAADVGAAAPTSLDVEVPPLPPGTYDWRVAVDGRTVARPGFVVEEPPLGAAVRASAVDSQQRDPAVVATATGFLPVWVDDRLGSKDDLIARPIAPDGTLPGVDAVVTEAGSTLQARPHLAYDAGRGRALVAWQDGSGTTDVLARFVDPAGLPLTATFAAAAEAGAQGRPRVAYDAVADAYLIAYRDGNDVRARRISGDGATVDPAVAIAVGPGATSLLDVACSPAAGRHLVVWAGSGQVVRGQLLDAAGTPVGGAIDVAVGADEAQVQPAVAVDGATGDFLVVWIAQTTPPTVRVRRVAAADGTLGAAASVTTAPGTKANPRLAWVPWQGRFLVAWQGVGDGTDVVAAYVDRDGAPWGAPFTVAGGPGTQCWPEIAVLPGSSRALVVYEHQAGGPRWVQARRLR